MPEADRKLGKICVTYLNYNIFDKTVARVSSAIRVDWSPLVIVESVNGNPTSSVVSKLAQKYLKHWLTGHRDIRSSLEQIIQQQPEIREADKCAFYAYARKYWLVHTKSIDLSRTYTRDDCYELFYKLLDRDENLWKQPWDSVEIGTLGDAFKWNRVPVSTFLKMPKTWWTVKNDHVALLRNSWPRKKTKRGRPRLLCIC